MLRLVEYLDVIFQYYVILAIPPYYRHDNGETKQYAPNLKVKLPNGSLTFIDLPGKLVF